MLWQFFREQISILPNTLTLQITLEVVKDSDTTTVSPFSETTDTTVMSPA